MITVRTELDPRSRALLAALVDNTAEIADQLSVISGTFTEVVHPPPHVAFAIALNGQLLQGRDILMEVKEGQGFDIRAKLLTEGGHPAAYQKGSVEWTLTDDSDAFSELTVDPADELHVTGKCVDGSNNSGAVITFNADGDPDADQTRELVGTLDLVATQGEATVVSLDGTVSG